MACLSDCSRARGWQVLPACLPRDSGKLPALRRPSSGRPACKVRFHMLTHLHHAVCLACERLLMVTACFARVPHALSPPTLHLRLCASSAGGTSVFGSRFPAAIALPYTLDPSPGFACSQARAARCAMTSPGELLQHLSLHSWLCLQQHLPAPTCICLQHHASVQSTGPDLSSEHWNRSHMIRAAAGALKS